MFRKTALAAGIALFSALPAYAQPGPRADDSARVQVSISFFLPGPVGETDEAVKLRDRARSIVYAMAGKECDLLRETLAKDCRVEAVNVNVGRQGGQQQAEGIHVNGSTTLRVTVK